MGFTGAFMVGAPMDFMALVVAFITLSTNPSGCFTFFRVEIFEA
jgi:hypothetical protein